MPFNWGNIWPGGKPFYTPTQNKDERVVPTSGYEKLDVTGKAQTNYDKKNAAMRALIEQNPDQLGTITNTGEVNKMSMFPDLSNVNWGGNIFQGDRRGYNNYDGAQEYNPNLFKGTGIGRFDPRNMMRPSNLTQDLGASTFQAPVVPQGVPFNPAQGNIPYQGKYGDEEVTMFGKTANTLGNFAGDLVSGAGNIKNRLSGGITNILDNTILGRIAAMRDATNPRAANYNPALQGQIDYLQSSPEVAGATLGHGATRAGNKITGGSLYGQNLQSMFGSNDLIDMYNKQIARHDKTIEGFADQWGNLKEEDINEYNRKLAVHQKRRDWAQAEKDAAIAGTTGGGVEGGQTAGMRGQLGRAENAADRRNIQQIQQHTGRELSGYRMDRPSSERQFTGHGRSGMGRSADRFAAEGGRIGYRDGEFVDEDINIEGPGFDVNENIEMVEGGITEEQKAMVLDMLERGMDLPTIISITGVEEADILGLMGGETSMAEDQGIASLV